MMMKKKRGQRTLQFISTFPLDNGRPVRSLSVLYRAKSWPQWRFTSIYSSPLRLVILTLYTNSDPLPYSAFPFFFGCSSFLSLRPTLFFPPRCCTPLHRSNNSQDEGRVPKKKSPSDRISIEKERKRQKWSSLTFWVGIEFEVRCVGCFGADIIPANSSIIRI